MRCYLEPNAWSDSPLSLSKEESHHLLSVLRAKAGEELTLFDGQGREALAKLTQAKAKQATIEILRPLPQTKPPQALGPSSC